MTALLRELRDVIWKLENEARPVLKSVTMHPDDFRALRELAAVKATTPDLYSDPMFGPLRFLGVPIYQSETVPRGQPWYDPPAAVQQASTPADQTAPPKEK